MNKEQTKTLDIWVDMSFRCMREKFRTCVTCWMNNEYDLLIDNAKNLRKNLDSFIGYLENKRKFG
jgi:hypothetical protein